MIMEERVIIMIMKKQSEKNKEKTWKWTVRWQNEQKMQNSGNNMNMIESEHEKHLNNNKYIPSLHASDCCWNVLINLYLQLPLQNSCHHKNLKIQQSISTRVL